MRQRFVALLLVTIAIAQLTACQTNAYRQDGRAYYVATEDASRELRLTWYGDAIARLQTAHAGEAYLPDDHYEMVVRHDWPHNVKVRVNDNVVVFASDALEVHVNRLNLAAGFYKAGDDKPVLRELAGASLDGNRRIVQFSPTAGERLTGLGHGYFARAERLDLTGTVIERNYGSAPIEQAPLIVPFYLSSAGYGVFLNSTFPNRFALKAGDDYSIAIDTHGFTGQMDYFFIGGPGMVDVLDHYTQLTGRPRLPPKSVFGLQLSDKGHDHDSPTPSDEAWWRAKITAHREAGLPLDHVVNDNRWRAGGGKRCESRIEWDAERYPDPAAWARWLDAQGLTSTIDFNRCIARQSDGWQPAFNLPPIEDIEFADSAPDLTNAEFRRWFWQVFYDNALDPSLGYPGEALWIDEFDEQGAAPMDVLLANGRSFAEMRNYWFFLIAKALVAEGWDASDIERRPFVWVRGMTAGAQRYATLWSGDIRPTDTDMASQIRGMQLAGLSAFPFWGHDAGGFYDWEARVGPDESLYQRWAMALGSLSPIWKPHGMGDSRWPLDRDETSQAAARRYAALRYELMPYLYSVAHEAADTGVPIVRPMLLAYPNQIAAWQNDLQYFFGPSLLVAPRVEEAGTRVWLPGGGWYSIADRRYYTGGRSLDFAGEPGDITVLARAGAIIPKRPPALSTAFIDKTQLAIDIYTGADGAFRLVEDDDRTDAYRNGERRITWLRYDDNAQTLTIEAASGGFDGAPGYRDVTLTFISPDGTRTLPARRVAVDQTTQIANRPVER